MTKQRHVVFDSCTAPVRQDFGSKHEGKLASITLPVNAAVVVRSVNQKQHCIGINSDDGSFAHCAGGDGIFVIDDLVD